MKVIAQPYDGEAVNVWIHYDARDGAAVDQEGIAADLRQAGATFGDGVLVVARACFLRAGVKFSVRAKEDKKVVLSLQLEPAQPGTDSAAETSHL